MHVSGDGLLRDLSEAKPNCHAGGKVQAVLLWAIIITIVITIISNIIPVMISMVSISRSTIGIHQYYQLHQPLPSPTAE